MPTFKITIAYDGTSYVGWQRQAKGTSIQGLIEDALRPLDGRDVVVHGAGRTDAGVHAIGQVASFTLARPIDASSVMRAANSRLPSAIRIVAAEAVDVEFHARYRAQSKTYRYRIANGALLDPFMRAYAWHVAGALDVPGMRSAARTLEGRHDFAAFQASGAMTKTTERELLAVQIFVLPPESLCVPRVLGGGEVITIGLTGRGFLRHMARIIVGSLVEIGRGRRDAAWLAQLLAGRDRTRAGPTAPAHGLCLVAVEYAASVLADEP